MEESGLSLIWGTIPMPALRDWGRPQETSVRILSVPAGVEPDTSQIQVRRATTWTNSLDQMSEESCHITLYSAAMDTDGQWSFPIPFVSEEINWNKKFLCFHFPDQ
jgi:hypothetical protein